MARARNAPAGPGRVLWTTVEIAQAVGWFFGDGRPNHQRVRRWLERDGLLTRRGRHYYAGRNQLIRAFGEEAGAIVARLCDD